MHPLLSKKGSAIVITSASTLPSSKKELGNTGISYLLVRMSNDKVVGIGGDGHGSHREVVSRNCAVKLGRNNRNEATPCDTVPQERQGVPSQLFLNSIPWNSKGSIEVPIYVRHFPKPKL